MFGAKTEDTSQMRTVKKGTQEYLWSPLSRVVRLNVDFRNWTIGRNPFESCIPKALKAEIFQSDMRIVPDIVPVIKDKGRIQGIRVQQENQQSGTVAPLCCLKKNSVSY